jgi:hypothetical protein
MGNGMKLSNRVIVSDAQECSNLLQKQRLLRRLSRLEAKLAMEILLQRFELLTLQEPTITWIDSYFARGPQHLPIRFTAVRN